MNKKIFNDYYVKVITTLTDILKKSTHTLKPWFPTGIFTYPPVIGFGLPEDYMKIPLITIGLNPSIHEYPMYISSVFDVNIQWDFQHNYFQNPYRSWFDRAQAVVNGVSNKMWSYGGIYGVEQKAMHLDFFSFATEGIDIQGKPVGFDGTFDRFADKPGNSGQKDAALQLLQVSATEILLPLLKHFIEAHDTRSIIIFGWIPPTNGGSATMRGLSRYIDVFKTKEKSIFISNNITLAEGYFNPTYRNSLSVKDDITIVYFSKGPSSRIDEDSLKSAGQAVFNKGWV